MAPRFARPIAPAVVHHVVIRFVNREYRMSSPGARDDYLARLGESLAKTDWTVFGFALMSSHIHLATIAGSVPLSRLLQPVHSGFARALNRREGRSGPVFAERPTTVLLEPERTGYALAYVHNNPRRAGLVRDAAASPWTSHAAYLGIVPAPPWLDIARGLELCGFDTSTAGIAAFDAFVRSRAGDPRDPELSGAEQIARRVRLRRAVGAPVELSSMRLETDPPGVSSEIFAPVGARLRPAWPGELNELLGLAAERVGVAAASMQSRTRARDVVRGRRLVVLTATRHLGRTVTEAGALVGLSTAGASRLLHRAPTRLEEVSGLATELANECWRSVEPR